MRRFLPVLVVVAAAVGGLWAWGAYQRHVGELRATIRAKDAAIVALRARSARLDTVYVQVRDTLRVVRTRTDSFLVHRTDTLLHVDTVRQLVERERLACDAVISSCEARVAARDSLIWGLQDQLRAERGKDRMPLLHVKLPSRTASLGLGLGAGLLGGLLLRR